VFERDSVVKVPEGIEAQDTVRAHLYIPSR
jgi:hypothetical protein